MHNYDDERTVLNLMFRRDRLEVPCPANFLLLLEDGNAMAFAQTFART